MQNLELTISLISHKVYLSWAPYPNADNYRLYYSNGRKSDIVKKTIFCLPPEVDIGQVVISIIPLQGKKKLLPKTHITSENTKFAYIEPGPTIG